MGLRPSFSAQARPTASRGWWCESGHTSQTALSTGVRMINSLVTAQARKGYTSLKCSYLHGHHESWGKLTCQRCPKMVPWKVALVIASNTRRSGNSSTSESSELSECSGSTMKTLTS
jgi:hypothetical protein